jgi:hypothetical protein
MLVTKSMTSLFAKGSKAYDFKQHELVDDCSGNTDGELRLAYRKVTLLSLGGATYSLFQLPVLFSQLEQR